MERTRWTDERLDDLVVSTDSQFALLRMEIDLLRSEIRELRDDFAAWSRQMTQLAWMVAVALAGAMLAAAGAIVTAVAVG